ncbi:MAG: hypothetical protein JO345_16670 [Streptosporangiaceae bacterium]|nr:hypothetical protein [Streptosporangiaceae bacterium]
MDEHDKFMESDAPMHKKVIEEVKTTMGAAAWCMSVPVVEARGRLAYRKHRSNGDSHERAQAAAEAQVEDEHDRTFGWGYDNAGLVWRIAKKMHGL